MVQYCCMRQAEHKLFRLNDVNNLLNETDEYETKKSRRILKHVLTTLLQSWPETLLNAESCIRFLQDADSARHKSRVRWIKVRWIKFASRHCNPRR